MEQFRQRKEKKEIMYLYHNFKTKRKIFFFLSCVYVFAFISVCRMWTHTSEHMITCMGKYMQWLIVGVGTIHFSTT